MQNPEKTVLRANRAAELMADPLMVEAKAHIEAELWRKFKELAPNDAEGLMFTKGMQYLHEKYFAFLNAAANDGKIARLEVERKKKSIADRIRGR